MTTKNMVAEATEEDSAEVPARTGTLHRVLAKRRLDLKGALGSTEMVQLIGVILLITLLAGGTFVYLRFIRGSSENSVVQRNVDEVAKLGDSFWQNYAADLDGRRKVSLSAFCDFADNQLAEEDLNLRTLQIGGNGGAVGPDSAPTGSAATRIVVNDGIDDTEASCFDSATHDPAKPYQDIYAYTATGALGAAITDPTGTPADRKVSAYAADDAVTPAASTATSPKRSQLAATAALCSWMCGADLSRSYSWNLRCRSRRCSDHSLRIPV